LSQYVRSSSDGADQIEKLGWPVSQTKFDKLLLVSVDQALGDLLGNIIRNQIYDHLATKYNYGREDIPRRIEDFYAFLQNTFASASKTVGRTIIRRLFSNLGYEYVNVPGFEFFDYLEAVRARAARDAASRERGASCHP
jgi:hypothetical protein